jgi:hypothetical protein
MHTLCCMHTSTYHCTWGDNSMMQRALALCSTSSMLRAHSMLLLGSVDVLHSSSHPAPHTVTHTGAPAHPAPAVELSPRLSGPQLSA